MILHKERVKFVAVLVSIHTQESDKFLTFTAIFIVTFCEFFACFSDVFAKLRNIFQKNVEKYFDMPKRLHIFAQTFEQNFVENRSTQSILNR